MKNYEFASIATVSKLIKDKKISPVDLVESFLKRIEVNNAKLNAFITVLADDARKQARIAEAEINSGQWKGQLHGIPVALKTSLIQQASGQQPLISILKTASPRTMQ